MFFPKKFRTGKKEFSIELTNQLNQLKLHKKNISQYITNPIIDSSTIEERIVNKYDHEKSKKTKYRKNSGEEDKRIQKLRKYQRASKFFHTIYLTFLYYDYLLLNYCCYYYFR